MYRTDTQILNSYLDSLYNQSLHIDFLNNARSYCEKTWNANDLKEELLNYHNELEIEIDAPAKGVLFGQRYTLTVYEDEIEWSQEEYKSFFECMALKLKNSEDDYDRRYYVDR